MTPRQWLRQKPWLNVWLPLVAWSGLIFWLSAQPDLPNPGSGWVGDVISSAAHAFEFGVLAVLWARTLKGRSREWPIAFALTALYALSDEFHQAFVPGRHPDPLDLLCDGLGAVLGLVAWARLWLPQTPQGSGRIQG